MRAALWLVLMTLPGLALAAGRADELAKEYVAATGAEDWNRAMTMVRPADLSEVAGSMRQVLISPAGSEVRDYLGELQKDPKELSDAEIVGQLFRATFAKYREMGVGTIKVAVLGSVKENPDNVHFVQRTEAKTSGELVSQISVLSLTRESGTWYVKLPETLRAQARNFAEQLKDMASHAE